MGMLPIHPPTSPPAISLTRQRVRRDRIPVSVSPLAVDTRTAEDMVGGPRILAVLRDRFGLMPLEPEPDRKKGGKQVWSVGMLTTALARMERDVQR